MLVVLHEENLGGASLSVLRCVEPLEQFGWQFTFWAPHPSALYDELRALGLETYGAPRGLIGYSWKALRIPPGPWRRLRGVPRYLAELRRVIKELDPVVVHANSMYTVPEAAMARAMGKPTLIHVHEMVRANRKGDVAKRLIHSLGHVVAAVSRAGCDALAARGTKPRLIPECVPVPEQPANRQVPSDAVRVGTVGVLSRRKGTDTFVEAASLLSDSTIQFELVGAPTAPLDRAWAEKLLTRLPDNVRHRDWVDVNEELRAWDVFTLPSREDPFPIVVLEAMALGLPVVGTRVDGIAEQISEDTGILVPPNDPAALAAAIKRLADDPDLRASMGQAARQRVIDNFSIERQSRLIDESYRAAQALAK